jgi:hypothetical protein
MKRNIYLDIVNDHQGFAIGFLLATMIIPTIPTRIMGFILLILMIMNRFYQIKLKYRCKEVKNESKNK